MINMSCNYTNVIILEYVLKCNFMMFALSLLYLSLYISLNHSNHIFSSSIYAVSLSECVYVYVSLHVCVCVQCYASISQGTICGNQFSPTVLVQGMKLTF